jgi:YVTN family beta-propeller protein
MIRRIQKFSFLVFLIFYHYSYAISPDRTIALMNVGVTPAGIALTPDNRFAYVANNNNYGIANSDNVSVLNLTNNTVVTTINDASFMQPYTVTINASGTKAYITNSFGTTISIINTISNTVEGIIGGFDGPSGMVITPDGTRAYVNNYGAGMTSGTATTVRVVDLNTNTIIGAPIMVGLAPAAIAISPDGRFVYTINYVDGNPGTGTMSVIQTSNNTVIATIPGFSGPFAIAITSDGKFAYVTNFGSNNFTPVGTTVSVVDLTINAIVATIPIGIQPSSIAITPDSRYAYVTSYDTLYTNTINFTGLTAGQGTVNIIDIASNTLLPVTIPVGRSPAGIAISSDGKFAYLTNYTSNIVLVLDILERMWLK